MPKLFLTWVTCTAMVGWTLACGGPPSGEAPAEGAVADAATEAIDFSFVFVGCNRVGWDPDTPTPSTANVAQLNQTFQDIADLQQSAGLPAPPKYLFLVGDIVRNEREDKGQALEKQLAAWQPLWENGPLAHSETQLVPMTGNHEVLYSVEFPADGGKYYEIPNPPAYDVWRKWFAQHGYDRYAGNGPTPESDPEDLLAGDASRMTYSFSASLASGKNAHFVIIDTDTLSTARSTEASCLQQPEEDPKHYADDPLPGWLPAHWIAGDVEKANADPDTELIFAFGHKPIEAPGGSDTIGRANILNCDPYPLADRLLETFQTNGKFVGYLCAHTHEWAHAELGSDDARKVPQVVAGNGGSPLSGGDIFGFTLVRVYTSGKVTATSYGRQQPDPYDSPDSGGPATPRETVVLRQAAG